MIIEWMLSDVSNHYFCNSNFREDCTLGDTSSQLVHVISDIFIPELQGTVKSSLQEKNSISVVVQTIVQYIAEEIVPYTGSYVTNETSENRKEESKSMPS